MNQHPETWRSVATDPPQHADFQPHGIIAHTTSGRAYHFRSLAEWKARCTNGIDWQSCVPPMSESDAAFSAWLSCRCMGAEAEVVARMAWRAAAEWSARK